MTMTTTTMKLRVTKLDSDIEELLGRVEPDDAREDREDLEDLRRAEREAATESATLRFF